MYNISVGRVGGAGRGFGVMTGQTGALLLISTLISIINNSSNHQTSKTSTRRDHI